MAAYNAAIQIRDRLAHMLGQAHGVAAELVRFTPKASWWAIRSSPLPM
jgi:xanthine dehydrogenase molybdopterin-binding subunit B